jgi:hypothetical protein
VTPPGDSRFPPVWASRTEFRLVCFGLSAVAAVYIGFLGFDVGAADYFVKHHGYHMIALSFALWLACLWRLRPLLEAPHVPALRELLVPASFIALFTALYVFSEPFQSKVLYDEFVLQSTAYNMHHFRDSSTMVRGYDVLGVFLSTDNYLDKRPFFYPFLVSLLHDLTGYRPLNAHLLNAALYPVTLALAWWIGRALAGAASGLLAVLLLGTLPLLGQNATGAGMELLNVCMLLAVAALAILWLRQPDAPRLSSLVLGAVLLAQSRYESAIYIGPVALLVILGWWRAGRIILSWPSVVAPLLLVTYALQNKVLSNTKWMWELREDQETRFSVEYLPGNLSGAAEFLFNTSVRFANSWWLTALGLAAILGALIFLLWRRPSLRDSAPAPTVLGLLALGALANTGLLMFYYWSSFSDPMAARFALPLYLVFAFAAVAMLALADGRWPVVRLAQAATVVFGLGVTTKAVGQHLYSHLGVAEIEWEKEVVASRPAGGQRFVITNKSTLPWLLEKTPSILVGRARLVQDRLAYQMAEGVFRDVYVTQTFRPTTPDGDHEMLPDDRLPAGFHLRPVAERRFGTRITRISRVLSVDPPAPAAASPATD